MINLKIKGGLGNQLFEYAAARNLATLNNTDLNIDYSYYNHSGSDTPRQYLLDIFNIKPVKHVKSGYWYSVIDLCNKILRKLSLNRGVYFSKYYFEQGVEFDDKFFSLKDGVWLTGFFQSAKYFSESIREEFKFSGPDNIIETGESVFIHVRRGDYVNNSTYESCSLDYYNQAVGLIKEKVVSPKFYIFSDDIAWIKDNLNITNAIYLSNSDREDLYLMSQCRHAIIANSSFSWWGAWLINNPDKIVIAPSKWFRDKKINTKDLTPDKWIRI
jgi:Glycosyl transferase family 11